MPVLRLFDLHRKPTREVVRLPERRVRRRQLSKVQEDRASASELRRYVHRGAGDLIGTPRLTAFRPSLGLAEMAKDDKLDLRVCPYSVYVSASPNGSPS
jgi:hypothetical protein